jgi:hypothetical protein
MVFFVVDNYTSDYCHFCQPILCHLASHTDEKGSPNATRIFQLMGIRRTSNRIEYKMTLGTLLKILSKILSNFQSIGVYKSENSYQLRID